ncbi:hypothetical protein R1flu_016802 [Riccia fluitans]|uniref:Uncharacterized protein n=1 Tax=Riccia fluitans TaxID=41844 RepID=A0ABD1YMW9_9MARC
MATPMLSSSSICSSRLVRVSVFSVVRAIGFVHRSSSALVTRAELGKFPSLEQASISRREALLAAVVTGFGGSLGTALVLPPKTEALEEVKLTNLGIEDVKKVIEDDFISRNYLVTGDMTLSIYNENCRFKDPTTEVSGAKNYSEAVKVLFDSKGSKVELLNIEVSGPRTIDVKYILTGFLNLPWHPFIAPFEANARYTVGEDGLIESYDEEWSISLLEAFAQMVTPSAFRKDAPKVETSP